MIYPWQQRRKNLNNGVSNQSTNSRTIKNARTNKYFYPKTTPVQLEHVLHAEVHCQLDTSRLKPIDCQPGPSTRREQSGNMLGSPHRAACNKVGISFNPWTAAVADTDTDRNG